jgi:hypothetical protein
VNCHELNASLTEEIMKKEVDLDSNLHTTPALKNIRGTVSPKR